MLAKGVTGGGPNAQTHGAQKLTYPYRIQASGRLTTFSDQEERMPPGRGGERAQFCSGEGAGAVPAGPASRGCRNRAPSIRQRSELQRRLGHRWLSTTAPSHSILLKRAGGAEFILRA